MIYVPSTKSSIRDFSAQTPYAVYRIPWDFKVVGASYLTGHGGRAEGRGRGRARRGSSERARYTGGNGSVPGRHAADAHDPVWSEMVLKTQRSEHATRRCQFCAKSQHMYVTHTCRPASLFHSHAVDLIPPGCALVLAAGAYSLDIVNKAFSPAMLTSTSRPGAPGGRGDPPRPRSTRLTGHEGKCSSTSDPSPGASLSAGRSPTLRFLTREFRHSGGRAARGGVGRGE